MLAGIQTVKLGAQTHALSFYDKLGFTPQGPVFDDAGIPHREMILRL
jgi:predicted GNAT family N-acyltransferase